MEQKNLCLASTATLLAYRSIAQSFAENIFELTHLRSNWNLEYAESLKGRVMQILGTHLSEGKQQLPPDRINDWRELMISALTDLAIIRASVKVDFKEDKEFIKEFFAQTGFTQYFSDAKNGDHVCMYHFITKFANNISPGLIDKITQGGLDVNLIKRLIDDAKELDKFKDCFEVISDPSLIEDHGRKLLEDVYDEIRGICRIATAYYYFDPVKRESFNFFKALRNLQS